MGILPVAPSARLDRQDACPPHRLEARATASIPTPRVRPPESQSSWFGAQASCLCGQWASCPLLPLLSWTGKMPVRPTGWKPVLLLGSRHRAFGRAEAGLGVRSVAERFRRRPARDWKLINRRAGYGTQTCSLCGERACSPLNLRKRIRYPLAAQATCLCSANRSAAARCRSRRR
jgi:hypothetical protein